jgi:inhibitor of KinA
LGERSNLPLSQPYKIFPLGDSALTIDFGNLIDREINRKVIALFEHLRQQPPEGMIEAVPSYSSITIYYDVVQLSKKIKDDRSVYDHICRIAGELLSKEVKETVVSTDLIRIPVCYDAGFGTDLGRIATEKNISTEEIIDIHCAKTYRVFMLGFLPGFAYLGEVDERIRASRKSQPEKIMAGSVGIAGRQTGIYPLNSPGGWQIIGRTPLKMFDPTKTEPARLKAGDEVEFYSITRDEFENYKSGNS